MVFLVGALFGSVVFAQTPKLSPRFQTVYILSMPNGRDQYLASRLTSGSVLWVVSEPKNADAVLTDTVDENFWLWVSQTYPPPNSTGRATADDTALGRTRQSANKGTVFLVDPRRRLILWSTYDRAKDMSSDELDRSAARIANQLKTAVGKR